MGKRQWALSGAHPFIYYGYNALSFLEDFMPFGMLEILNKRGSTSLQVSRIIMDEGRLLPGVPDGPNLQNLGRASSYLFFKPAKTAT
jgi:hypothetical protein